MKYQAPFGSTDPNASYADRNTPGAVRGSAVPARAIEDPQRELDDFIAKSGLTPTEAVLQLAQAIQSGKVNLATAGGTANALIATLSPAPLSLYTGLVVRLLTTSANTGAMTFNLNGLGVKDIKGEDAAPLPANTVFPNGVITLIYNGTHWVLQGFAVSVAPPRNVSAYGTPGVTSWVCPAGVYWVRARVWGAGASGGAGNGSSGAGGGGGAGGYAEGWYKVTPGTSYSITVGAGGAAVTTSGANGNAGGSSSFASLCSATGGVGGNGSTAGGTGGPGGTSSGGQIGVSGNSGGNSATIAAAPVGGFGGSSYQGVGGSIGTVFGSPAQSTGSGGGGSSAASAGQGPGANGLVILEY